MGVKFRGFNINIGSNTVINSSCLLDGRGGQLTIGNNVDIAPYVKIWTVDHDPNSNFHAPRNGNVTIGNNSWIASSSTILPNVIISEGTVVAACSLVNSDTPRYSIVAGTPAKKINDRNINVQFKHQWRPWFE